MLRTCGHLLGRGGHLLQLVVDVADFRENERQHGVTVGYAPYAPFDLLAAFGHGICRCAGIGAYLFHQLRNLLCSLFGLIRQLANFSGNDGKTASMLADSGSLDRRIQREQVRLRADIRDELDHAADRRGPLFQANDGGGGCFGRRLKFFHIGHRPFQLDAALLRFRRHFACGNGDRGGRVGDASYAHGHFGYGLRRIGSIAVLLLCPLGDTVDRCGYGLGSLAGLFGTGGQLLGRRPDGHG
ncbi:hypothetical protein D3C74_280660 [compost metagenome]